MKTRSKTELVGLGVVTLITIAIIRWDTIRGGAREELLLAYAQIEPGASKSEVKALFGPEQFPNLKLREITADTLRVQTPLQWGAVNWLLWVESENEKVTAVRIRFQDEREKRPVDAPLDKVED